MSSSQSCVEAGRREASGLQVSSSEVPPTPNTPIRTKPVCTDDIITEAESVVSLCSQRL